MPKKRDGPVPRLRTAPGPKGRTKNKPSCLLRNSYARSSSTDQRFVFGPAAIAVGQFIIAATVVPDNSILRRVGGDSPALAGPDFQRLLRRRHLGASARASTGGIGIALDPDLIERARAVNMLVVTEQHGLKLAKRRQEYIGACPHCGGCSRFSVNPGKAVFLCRGCKRAGAALSTSRFSSADAASRKRSKP